MKIEGDNQNCKHDNLTIQTLRICMDMYAIGKCTHCTISARFSCTYVHRVCAFVLLFQFSSSLF